MELRVHGIGGTRPQAVLGLDPTDALVPRWPVGDTSSSGVWVGEDPEVGVYHWAPLTSGSRWFALWPLLLPFTLLNVAGFMHPTGVRGRLASGWHRFLCLTATAWLAAWLAFAGQILVAEHFGEWGPRSGLMAAAAAVGGLAMVSRLSAKPYRGDRLPTERDGVHWSGERGLADPGFFQERNHAWLLGVHLLTAGAILGHLATQLEAATSVRTRAGDVVTIVGTALVVELVVLGLLTMRRKRWAVAAVGAAGFGVALIGGTAMAALRTVEGTCGTHENAATPGDPCRRLRGPAFMLFDVYGWAVLGGVAAVVIVAVVTLMQRADGQWVQGSRQLLPNPQSWLMARVARIPARLAIVVGVSTITFLVVGSGLFVWRASDTMQLWCHDVGKVVHVEPCQSVSEDDEEQARADQDYVVVDGADERVAQFALFSVAGFILLGFVRSKLTLASLRRLWARSGAGPLRNVGSIWDVLAFWPRSFHPLAVRPYSRRVVPELQALLVGTSSDQGWIPPVDGALVVLAHSQGTVLVAAALAPYGAAAEPVLSSVERLVTVGSPIRSLYHGAFPAYVPDDTMDWTTRALGGDRPRWCNAFRFTDPVGRTVFRTEREWVNLEDDLDVDLAGVTTAWHGRSGDLRQVEVALRDPIAAQHLVEGHNGYWLDPRVRLIVEKGV